MLRLAHNIRFSKGSICILCLWSLFVCLACTGTRRKGDVDRLNSISYDYHYRDIDSTAKYAFAAYRLSSDYSSGKAEALNNLSFVNIAHMNYSAASRQLDSVYSITDNQIELLVADVQYMRLCQRQALNKNFYDYKERARKRMSRIREEEQNLSPHLRRRFNYAKSEYSFVSSTYYYYVGLLNQSRKALDDINRKELIQSDTAQYLNWLYQTGSGGMILGENKHSVLQTEYERLLECYLLSRQYGFVYWEANSLQALGELLFDKSNRRYLVSNNKVSMGYVNADNMPDTLVAGYLAQKSVDMFSNYGDAYQVAGSLRTLSKCYWGIGDNLSALHWLNYALTLENGKIKQAPDLVASIREQLSIVYSSLNDKYNSDVNRNIYLDMQEKTRQDMELDARAAQLDKTSNVLNVMILGIVILISVLFVLIFILLKNSKKHSVNVENLYKALDDFVKRNQKKNNELNDIVEELEEKYELILYDKDNNKRRNIENRAKAFLVESIKPLINRMSVEIGKLTITGNDDMSHEDIAARYEYIRELTEIIDKYNDVLTGWIQLRQGEVGLHIESFPLSDVFDIVARGKTLFSLQGVTLTVNDTDAVVKADKVLTLFMINTLADNARKNTPAGGKVEIRAKKCGENVEISVSDTGKGMTPEEVATLFTRNISKGHGFGLLNCRGILNRYKKYSSLFSQSTLSVESEKGKGSRFFFTLPMGIMRSIVILFVSMLALVSFSQNIKNVRYTNLQRMYINKAAAFADSAYNSNIKGEYSKTLEYSDSVVCSLNAYYLTMYPTGRCLMHNDGDAEDAAEIQWYHSELDMDYSVILGMRNESAVAALALHKWKTYEYNNDIYTKLFKEVSADGSLGEYCRIMQRSETNKNIAITMLTVLVIILLVTCYIIFYRRTVRRHSMFDLCSEIENLLLDDSSIIDKISRMEDIKGRKYYTDISALDRDIFNALTCAKASEDEYTAKKDSISDSIRKVSYERDRLYVCNNILENCLSAIKHETMYYPARINQYVSSCDDSEMNSTQLNALNDIVSYYRELYFALCEQIHKQTNVPVITCAVLNLADLISVDPVSVYGDRLVLDMLFNILRKKNLSKSPRYVIRGKEHGMVVLAALMENVRFPENGANSLFAAGVDNIPYMLCRQIIRELENVTNCFGCGIKAENDNGRLVLLITLPRRVGGTTCLA